MNFWLRTISSARIILLPTVIEFFGFQKTEMKHKKNKQTKKRYFLKIIPDFNFIIILKKKT